jgi:sugar phosphate isomerase/epimerase
MANINVSCSTGCIPTYNRAEAMEAVARAGFNFIEGYAFETESRLHPDVVFPDQVIDDLRKYRLKLSGLNISDITVGCNLTGIKREIEYAASLGIKTVNVKGGLRTERDMKALINSLKILVKVAQAHDIGINVRNHHGNRVDTLEDLEIIFGEVNHHALGLALDVGQLHCSKIDPLEAISRFFDRIRVVYVRDQVGSRVVGFGEGEIDIDGVVVKLLESGYKGLIVAEPYVHKNGVEKYMADAHLYLRKLLSASS